MGLLLPSFLFYPYLFLLLYSCYGFCSYLYQSIYHKKKIFSLVCIDVSLFYPWEWSSGVIFSFFILFCFIPTSPYYLIPASAFAPVCIDQNITKKKYFLLFVLIYRFFIPGSGVVRLFFHFSFSSALSLLLPTTLSLPWLLLLFVSINISQKKVFTFVCIDVSLFYPWEWGSGVIFSFFILFFFIPTSPYYFIPALAFTPFCINRFFPINPEYMPVYL